MPSRRGKKEKGKKDKKKLSKWGNKKEEVEAEVERSEGATLSKEERRKRVKKQGRERRNWKEKGKRKACYDDMA